MTYAKGTTVPIGRSRDEIERTLERFEADQFMWGRDDARGAVTVGFRRDGKGYRFTIIRPDPSEFARTPTGRSRYRGTAEEMAEQEFKRRLRSLSNYIKATLDAVDSGIISAEEALIAYRILPSGETVGELATHQLANTDHVNFTLALKSGDS